jgi:glycine cleavage system H protein
MAYPTDYRYTEQHEWLKVDGSTGTIGITDYAQHQLGDIVYVDVPGSVLEAGKPFGTVEAVKTTSELYAPVSGKIIEVNHALNDSPAAVNENAHSAWMVKIELTNPAEVDSLLSAEQYEVLIAEET